MRTRTKLIFPLTVLVAVLLTGCSVIDGSAQLVEDAVASSTASPSEPAGQPAAQWAYNGAEGPTAWGSLDPAYAECGVGTAQSPVDLPASAPATSELTLDIHDVASAGEVADTGHTGQFTPNHAATGLEFNGREYSLAQLHFHVPAEHTIAGERAAAEFHLVHQDSAGNTLVVALLAQEGDATPGIEPFIKAATAGTSAETAVDFGSFLPETGSYLSYVGSLTTPPCTENVQWVVLTDPITLSLEQIDQLESLHGENSRPLTDLGDRDVSEGTVSIDRD